MPNVYKKFVSGDLYDFLDFQKGTSGAPFSRSMPPKTEYPELRLATWCQPCRRLLDEDVLSFDFVIVFSMCLYYSLSYHSFSRIDSNPAAVWPSIFNKSGAAFEQLRFCKCPSSCLLIFGSSYFSVDVLVLVGAP